MGGKASLILVIGFSVIFMTFGRYFGSIGVSSTDNMLKYYNSTKTHHLATSGINLVVNQLFLNAAYADGTYNFTFDGGTIAAVLVTTDNVKNIRQLTSTSTFNGVSNSVRVILKPSMFSKYAYFSNSEGGVLWTSKDTVWGPMHTNDNLNVQGNPVFEGKVSIGGTVNTSSGSAKFLGGLQKNIQITIPATGVSSVGTAVTTGTGGANISGHSLMYLEFRGDSVRYRYASSGAYTYKLASTFAPNGIIYVANAEVHIKGTVKGQYTVAASGSSGTQGSIWIDDNIVYNTDPQTNPASTDMLGIVAQNNVWVADNTANNATVNIQASIYCQTGSFGAENYSTRPVAGTINLYGGITQATRGAVGTLSGTTITHGFSKRYRYDNRLLTSYPPAYPGCGTFEIISWFE